MPLLAPKTVEDEVVDEAADEAASTIEADEVVEEAVVVVVEVASATADVEVVVVVVVAAQTEVALGTSRGRNKPFPRFDRSDAGSENRGLRVLFQRPICRTYSGVDSITVGLIRIFDFLDFGLTHFVGCWLLT